MWALLEGHIGPNTTVFEASSGNTARSEAYFCKLIGLKFVAVVRCIINKISIFYNNKPFDIFHRYPKVLRMRRSEKLRMSPEQ